MRVMAMFIRRVAKTGVKRPTSVKTVAMGREREFFAWDIGDDTFIFEKGVATHLDERPSVLVVEKSSLTRKRRGMIMTMTTGNHSVAAFPLLDGRFWKFSHVPKLKTGDVLVKSIICANVVDDTIEISQRDVPSKILFKADEWLLDKVGFALNDIVMGDRNDQALAHYRHLGQEWRVKPLAWTEAGMKVALAASQKRISSKLRYYHSSKGVHFMSFSEFKRFAALASADREAFTKALRELVSVFEGNHYSFTRMPKIRGHHEIEFFGLPRGVAVDKIIPQLERLMESIVLGQIDDAHVVARMNNVTSLYESLLSKAEFADENARAFTENLYMHITGEIYSVASDGATPAFDDRRTALPGATFVDGRPAFHPGTDDRNEVLLSNIRALQSKDEIIEYANVYELRGDDEDVPLGKGRTREIVYKTNRSPIERSLIEKRFGSAKKGYSSYMLARIEGFKALGIGLGQYRILRRRAKKGRTLDYFIRDRMEGEPINGIPANYFCNREDTSIEEKEVVLAVAQFMGDAAAQNMAMKKYDPVTQTPLFGVGKEIYEFEYDLVSERVVPKKVTTCSVRGSFGWPDISHTDENLSNIANFYLTFFAHALKIYQKQHKVTMIELADRFLDGFEYRTNAMLWQLSVMRDEFEDFKPNLPPSYRFDKKWRFILWSLERQARRMSSLRKMFFKKVEMVDNENIRDNTKQIRVKQVSGQTPSDAGGQTPGSVGS